MALNGCKGAEALYLLKAMLQGSYPQVGRCAILKACCSWALPTHARYRSGGRTQRYWRSSAMSQTHQE